VVLARQSVESQGLLDVLLDPGTELGVGRLSLGEPRRAWPRRDPPVVQPAELAQAVVVDLAGHVIERIAQEVHVAALPGGFRQHLDDRLPEPGVVVGPRQASDTVI
jgi:hypothetical protein